MDTQQARQTLADIEARHEEIMKLEKSIREVHDLFVDMATLIEKQGDKIDSIENHVSNTRSFVERAKEETTKALEYQGKARTVCPRDHFEFKTNFVFLSLYRCLILLLFSRS